MGAGEELAKVLWYYGLIPDASQSQQKIVCPFHDDVNPSMKIDLEDGSWYCFGCGRSGDARKFVRLAEGMRDGCNDLEALRRFSLILRSRKANELDARVIQSKRRRPSRQLYNEAYDYYHGLSKTRWRDSDDPDVIAAREYMSGRGFTAETLQACGAKVNYSRSYGIIFPMLDNGKFKGWVCRTMIPEVESKRKYLYNEGFSRATTLVGSYGEESYVIVVEGYMDRLKLRQMGLKNVVAILGWKMTAEQIIKLKAAGVTDVISALDNDECGRRGTKWLQRHFNVTRWRYLKGIKDPGDFTSGSFDKMYDKTMREYEKGQQNGTHRQDQARR